MTIAEFDVRGLPYTKGSWRSVGKGRMIPDDPRSAAWEALIQWYARVAWRRRATFTRTDTPIADRVGVVLLFVLPVPPNKAKKHRRDIDKLARCALDALTGIIYLDDEQVDELEVSKITSSKSTELGVHVRVYRIEPEPKETDDGA